MSDPRSLRPGRRVANGPWCPHGRGLPGKGKGEGVEEGSDWASQQR